VSRCASKAGFRDEETAARARDRWGLDPGRNTTYQCETCRLWHYGRTGAPKRKSRARRARSLRYSSETTLGQALHAAGWTHSAEQKPEDLA
jgi:hypothetical protein